MRDSEEMLEGHSEERAADRKMTTGLQMLARGCPGGFSAGSLREKVNF